MTNQSAFLEDWYEEITPDIESMLGTSSGLKVHVEDIAIQNQVVGSLEIFEYWIVSPKGKNQ